MNTFLPVELSPDSCILIRLSCSLGCLTNLTFFSSKLALTGIVRLDVKPPCTKFQPDRTISHGWPHGLKLWMGLSIGDVIRWDQSWKSISSKFFRTISAWFMGLLKCSFIIPNFQIYPANNLEVRAHWISCSPPLQCIGSMLKAGKFKTLKLPNRLQEKYKNWGCENYASKDPHTMRKRI